MVTQKFIAQKLGISTSLVSRALAGTAKNIGASDETIRKIREAAAELGYAPNAAALTLRGAKSKTIGVIIKDFDDPFLGRMTGALQELARKSGYSLLLTGFDVAKRKPLDLSSLLRYRLDALIVCGSDICSSWVKSFQSRDIPVAQIGSDADCAGVSRVEMDEAAGIEFLVDFVIKSGHRRIGFIGSVAGPHLRRRHMLEAELERQGVSRRDTTMISVPESENAGLAAMKKLLAKTAKKRPTVVLAADDSMAQGALRAVYDAGLAVPHDLSLTGIDDIPAAGLMIPALTTIRSPIDRMVAAAFELVFEPAGGGPGRVTRLAPELVVRESCAAPPPKNAAEPRRRRAPE
jgi:LacI family transcriptional regulator